MLKWIFMSILISYIVNRYLIGPIRHHHTFSPPPTPQKTKTEEKKEKKFTDNIGEYTDYEEIK